MSSSAPNDLRISSWKAVSVRFGCCDCKKRRLIALVSILTDCYVGDLLGPKIIDNLLCNHPSQLRQDRGFDPHLSDFLAFVDDRLLPAGDFGPLDLSALRLLA